MKQKGFISMSTRSLCEGKCKKMADILELITAKDRLEFSQNFPIARDYAADRLMPDEKTENLIAEAMRLSGGVDIPRAAMVHGFNTEAEIGERRTAEILTIEKLLIKEKINQSERVEMLKNRGVVGDDAIVRYIYDDMGTTAEHVKTRTVVAKYEALSSGKMTVKENNLNFTVDLFTPSENLNFSFNWDSVDADILGDIQSVVDAATAKGKTITGILTTTKQIAKMRKNKGMQMALLGTLAAGTMLTRTQIQGLFTEIFGFGTIDVEDRLYEVATAPKTYSKRPLYPDNKMTFYTTSVGGTVGRGLWGVPPEERKSGPFTEKSMQQYITIAQWEEPDPVATWTKASGVFIPVLTDPDGLFVATITSNP